MLTVRNEQIELFRRIPRERFEDRLVNHCFAFYRRECDALGEGQVRKVVSYGINQAISEGYETQQEAAHFLSLMFLFGSFFYSDPQLPWAVGDLANRTLRERIGRIQDVYETALNYMGKTAGDNNQYLVRALLRIRSYDRHSLPESTGEDFTQNLCRVLESIYPEKFGCQNRAATEAVVREGKRSAARYGIFTGKGAAIYGVLLFMLGIGFDRDPLCPWAGEILKDPLLVSPGLREACLYREAIAYVEKSLSSD